MAKRTFRTSPKVGSNVVLCHERKCEKIFTSHSKESALTTKKTNLCTFEGQCLVLPAGGQVKERTVIKRPFPQPLDPFKNTFQQIHFSKIFLKNTLSTSEGENSDKTTLPSIPQLCTGRAWSSDETGFWKWGEKGAATYFTTEVGTGRPEQLNGQWFPHHLFKLFALAANEMSTEHPHFSSCDIFSIPNYYTKQRTSSCQLSVEHIFVLQSCVSVVKWWTEWRYLHTISVFCFLISVLQSCACKVVGGVAIIKVGSINNRPISCRVHSADGRVLEG